MAVLFLLCGKPIFINSSLFQAITSFLLMRFYTYKEIELELQASNKGMPISFNYRIKLLVFLVIDLRKVRYEELLPHEIVEERLKTPIAYLPIGLLEWHGPHLAVGNDALKVHALAIRVAQQGGGLVFPPLFYGENREHNLMEFDQLDHDKIIDKMALSKESFKPGYMRKPSYQQDAFYIELLLHILYEIESLGFEVIVILAGHYPLLHHARETIKEYAKNGKAKAWALSGYELVRDVIPEAGDHAAKWETSLLLILRPDCVDMSQLPKDRNSPLIGVIGTDPRDTTKEFGEFAVNTLVDRIVACAHQFLKLQRQKSKANNVDRPYVHPSKLQSKDE
jgi:creatinine amidohydrolase